MPRREALDEHWLRTMGFRLEGDTPVRLSSDGPQVRRRKPKLPPAPEVTWRGHTVTIAHLQLRSESNLWEHWYPRWQRGKAQRLSVFWALRQTGWSTPKLPCTIRLVLVAPSLLDQGNLEASFKHVQDATADWLGGVYGGGNDRQPGLTWAYGQRQGAYAVEITLEEGV